LLRVSIASAGLFSLGVTAAFALPVLRAAAGSDDVGVAEPACPDGQ
jgi:hypothetical protein